MMISHYLPFNGLSRSRTYSVYPKGPDLQSGAEPNHPCSQPKFLMTAVGLEPTKAR